MYLEINNLSFNYSKKHSVLKNVSFTAEEGGFISLLGRNGAGKTTLFRCILGFLNNYRGTIKIDGLDARDIPVRERARKIAYIPQSHTSVFNYTVLLTVMMGLHSSINAFRGPTKLQENEAAEALSMLGISHLAERGVAEISGGERQLVLIARALVQKSKIFIMDEPTANLDYGNQVRVMKKIKEITKSGFLVLHSTHNPEQSLLFADSVIVLDDGVLSASGKPDEVLTPAMLEKIYRIPINVASVNTGGKSSRVCFPVI